MNFEEYQELASRTINQKLSVKEIELHALHGMSSEIGEVHSIYQKVYQGHDFDLNHVCSELGDLLWFVAEWCTAMGVDLDAIAYYNIEKLKARYPEGFDIDKSLHRAKGDI